MFSSGCIVVCAVSSVWAQNLNADFQGRTHLPRWKPTIFLLSFEIPSRTWPCVRQSSLVKISRIKKWVEDVEILNKKRKEEEKKEKQEDDRERGPRRVLTYIETDYFLFLPTGRASRKSTGWAWLNCSDVARGSLFALVSLFSCKYYLFLMLTIGV